MNPEPLISASSNLFLMNLECISVGHVKLRSSCQRLVDPGADGDDFQDRDMILLFLTMFDTNTTDRRDRV